MKMGSGVADETIIDNVFTLSSISFVCAAERQILILASMIGVAGKPTATVPTPLARHIRLKALKTERQGLVN